MNTIVGDGLFSIDLNIYPTDTSSFAPLCLLEQDHPLGFTPLFGQPTPSLSPDSLFSPPLPPGPPPPQPPLPPGPPPMLLPTLQPSPLPVLWEQQFQQPSWNEEEEWHSYQVLPWWYTEGERWGSIQALQRQEPEPRRNAEEEERWSSIQRQEPSQDVVEEYYRSNIQRQEPEQTTLTEQQIWEALDKLKNQEYIGEACAICLEYFVPEETVSTTPCKHMFHRKCLVPWVMQKGQCPHCRMFLFEAT